MSDAKRAPHNTTHEVQANPASILAEGMIFGARDTIERQESDGQRSFVGSDTLPRSLKSDGHYHTKPLLEAAGVKFLGFVEGDDLFQYVELPPGWKKQATDHSMWSKLIDDKGRERAGIFYKAAFYDRAAHLSLSRRFGVSFDYARLDKDGVGVSKVTDCRKVVHATEPIVKTESDESWDVSDKANKLATEWLDKNYPDWKNPGAYWD